MTQTLYASAAGPVTDQHLWRATCVGCGKTSFTLPLRPGTTHAVACRSCAEVTLTRIDANGGVQSAPIQRQGGPFPDLGGRPPTGEEAAAQGRRDPSARPPDWSTLAFEVDCLTCGRSTFTVTYGKELTHGVTCPACKQVTCLKVLADGSLALLPLPATSPAAKCLAEVLRMPGASGVSLWGLAMTAGLERETVTSIGLRLRLIGPGVFRMGHEDAAESARVVHQVTITRPFYIGVHPVTQEQFEKVMGGNPSRFKGANRPVEQVAWAHAVEFCKFLSEREGKTFRLPTEAEWEYAARAGTTTLYPWGNEIDPDSCWYKDNSDGQTHDVGLKNPNGWGLYDMCGNVWEWCQDRYGEYTEEPAVDPVGPKTGENRVIRGGSWNHFAAQCQATHRNGSNPAKGLNFIGFRVVMVPALPDIAGRRSSGPAVGT
ncbi:MAG: hypothetical protein OZSIB_1115 [Candidatus Ozemobacter sibiricus]|jgi:formylglycine-generating enzyme required for sulfatase activity|uniref:Sulfatase-modifying factor enzyme-like domain-containing protein n=1 Tax=Candidatus Ozemobacter sibiricus TaxID=2268124 RepID=A0A367ZN04_9BACT|nr:MAG: hypothetical protein OZSIB_1115 [Candidatus Ozemobacter sibiricus]